MDSGLAPDASAEHEAWLAQSLNHRIAFIRARHAWQRMNRLRWVAPLDRGTADPDLLKKERRCAVPKWAWSVGLLNIFLGAAWAPKLVASALLIGLAGVAAVTITERDAGTIYSTTIGAQQHLTLEDGSSVDLNTNTQIRVHFSKGLRALSLERGEAVFNVAHDASRPFEVTTAGIISRAIGTRFSVRLHEGDAVETVVADGRVLVLRESSILSGTLNPKPIGHTLSKGERLVVDARSARITRIGMDAVEQQLQWTTGKVMFAGERLEDVIRELNRYIAHPLTIRDSKLRRTPIGGAFDTQNADAYAEDLTTFFGEKRVGPAEAARGP
jgi:transmembrane sensor